MRLPVLVSLESGGTGDSVCVCICNGLHRFIPVLYKLTLCIMLHLHFVLDRKMVTMTWYVFHVLSAALFWRYHFTNIVAVLFKNSLCGTKLYLEMVRSSD